MNTNEETRPVEQMEQADQAVSQDAEATAVDTAEQPEKPDVATEQEAQADAAAEASESELDQFKSENDSLRSKLLESKARFAALALGISEARIDYAIRLAGLEGINVNDGDADKRIKEALNDVLGQIPEWAAEPKAPAIGTGSAGNHPRFGYGSGPSTGANSSAKEQFRNGMRR